MSLAPGSHLGPYEIRAPLGAGGMGEVFRARDSRLNREVAVKVLPEALAADESRRARFTLEAKATGALNHPGIVAIYDIGMIEGAFYMVTELVDGETLRTTLSEGNLPQRKAVDLAVQIAESLAAAQASGITHRDLKPENIMVTAAGRTKILDFGLAKQAFAPSTDSATQTQALTQEGTVLGTMGYMAPEQLRGKPVDARSDLFSFGVLPVSATCQGEPAGAARSDGRWLVRGGQVHLPGNSRRRPGAPYRGPRGPRVRQARRTLPLHRSLGPFIQGGTSFSVAPGERTIYFESFLSADTDIVMVDGFR